MLTERADMPKLHHTSKEIFRRVGAKEPNRLDRQHRRATIRNRLVWLSQFFYFGLSETKKHGVRILLTVMFSLAAMAGIGLLIKEAADYHPIYVQRIAEQQRKIDESKRESALNHKGHTEHGQKE